MAIIKLETASGKKLSLEDVIIDANIYNHIAQFTITQKYNNTETNPQEIFYTFPTPAGASVFDFTAKINDKIIKTILKEKTWAREDYNKAISDGDGAFLMERIDGDVFSVSLGNVQPSAKLEITIRYMVELKTEIDINQLRLIFPLTIMPKHLSLYDRTDESILQGNLVNPKKTSKKPYELSMKGTIQMSDGIIDVISKTCSIFISKKEKTSLNFDINYLKQLDEDIVLTIKRNNPQSNCLTQKATNLQMTDDIYRYATMINVIPNFEHSPKINPDKVHYVILIDKSSSMSGSDIENCKQGAKDFLNELPEGSSFDVYQFNHQFEKFKPRVESDKLAEAINWISTIRASGQTELKAAMIDVYESIKKTEKHGIILLLSDGGISNTNDVIKLAKSNQHVNIFTIGIGENVSQSLIQGLADCSNGKAEFVNSGTDQIKEKIIAQLKRAQTFSRNQKNNEIKINTFGSHKLVPERIPTLYENDINTFFVFSEAEIKSITYIQTLDDGHSFNNDIPIVLIDNENYPLHRMAGIKIIDELSSHPIGSKIPHQKQDPYKLEIISASLNLGILSNYTSFVGVEVRETSNKTTQECTMVEIPLQIPKKYNNESESKGSNSSSGLSSKSSSRSSSRSSGSSNKTLKAASFQSSQGNKCKKSRSLYNDSYESSNKSLSIKSKSDISSYDLSKSKSYNNESHRSNKSVQIIKPGSSMISNKSQSITPDDDSNCMFLPLQSLFNNTNITNDNTPKTSEKQFSQLEKYYKDNNLHPSLVINVNDLPKHIKSNGVLIAILDGLLPFVELSVNDYVVIIGSLDGEMYDGTYRVCSIGSLNCKWKLEKMND